jgi:serine/threonine protein kinase
MWARQLPDLARSRKVNCPGKAAAQAALPTISASTYDYRPFLPMTTPIPPMPVTGGAVYSPRNQRYLLGKRLGSGTFGAVFDCIGPFDQSFALKVFLPGNRPYAEVRAEWLKEAERLYRLRHPNIVYVHDYFEAAGLFYLVLERCDHSLDEMLSAPFTDRLVVDVARQLLFAVQYLADNEFVHNDLHAGNVLVVQGEHLIAKLSDLGIAQELYGYGGTRPPIVQHRLMAPEVAAGGYSTKQSDLYQLGLLIYQMHTGVYPIDTTTGYCREHHAAPPRAVPVHLRASGLGRLAEARRVVARPNSTHGSAAQDRARPRLFEPEWMNSCASRW